MPTVLITGAGRGLGLELARQYAGSDWHVIATCRNDAGRSALLELSGDLEIFDLDVTSADAIDSLREDLRDRPIDLLINNAGVLPDDDGRLGSFNEEMWVNVMSVNAFAPFKVVEALWPSVAKSKHRWIVAISSDLASMHLNDSGGMVAYRASKAALNSLMRSVSVELAQHGIITVMIHPGWVRTDMGGENAEISAQESVEAIRRLVDALTPDMNGRFFRYDGQELKW